MKKTLAVLALVAPLFAAADVWAAPSGKRLYTAYCGVCHGANGKGSGPLATSLAKRPANLLIEKIQAMPDGELMESLKGYSRGLSQMPVWGETLSVGEMRSIIAYVKVMDEPGIVDIGDIGRGREVYMQTCVACHGPDGRGNGILAQLIGADAADLAGEGMSETTAEQIAEIVAEGGGYAMPAWGGMLSDSEIRDVASYTKSLSEPPGK